MSGFNFNQTSNTGFSFGTQKPASTVAPTGFGTQSNTTASGGFSFGASNQAQTQAPSATPQLAGLLSQSTQGVSAPQGGFSFGTPTQTSFGAPTQTSTTGGGFSFGAVTSKPGLGMPVATQVASTAPTLNSLMTPSSGTGFVLGGLATQNTTLSTGGGLTFGTTTVQPQQPLGGFGFGVAKVQATAAGPVQPSTLGGQSTGITFGMVTPASTATGTTLGGTGFGFGIKASATPAPASSAPPAYQPPLASAGSLFSAPALSTTLASSGPTTFSMGQLTTSGVPVATAAPSLSTGSLMLKPLGTISSIAATTATSGSAAVFSLGLKSSTAMAPMTTTVTATAAAVTAPVMSYAQLEGLINKWSLELEDQERHFLLQATQVNAWDRMLVDNGERITSLHKDMEKVKLDQRRLDQELDFILSQQKELEDLLCPLEDLVKEHGGTIYMQNADEEREKTYKLAENVDAQLKRMSHDLKEIIEHLNSSSGPSDTSDPLQQICKILNAHMDSLQWVDQNSVLLQRRVEEVSKMCESRRKEQEKSFRLNFQ